MELKGLNELLTINK